MNFIEKYETIFKNVERQALLMDKNSEYENGVNSPQIHLELNQL
jgi:hypothetical protein